MKLTETILAYGHENIRATHRTTYEITKEPQLSSRGDCIIAVSADKATADLSSAFKENLRKENARIAILIAAEDVAAVVNAFGSPRLILTNTADMVVRKSNYICSRTLAIRADKAACDLPRNLVEKLKDSNQRVKITLTLRP